MENYSKLLGKEVPKEEVKNNNKSWTVLKEMILVGYRNENGFKVGYMDYLVSYMRKACPESNIQGNPHIRSKLKTWKNEYSFLLTLLDKSGSGGSNPETKTMNYDDEMWKQYVNGKSGYARKRHQPWPYFEDWKLIFGVDRATGSGVKDIRDAAAKILGETLMKEKEKRSYVEDIGGNDFTLNAASLVQESCFASSAKKGKPSIPTTDMEVVFTSAVDKMVSYASVGIPRNTRSRDDVLSEKRKNLHATSVQSCPNLSELHVMRLGRIFADNDKKLEYFFSLPDDKKEATALIELDEFPPNYFQNIR